MKIYRAGWAVACVAAVLGCSKGEQAGTGSAPVTSSATTAPAAKPAAPAAAADEKPDAYIQKLMTAIGGGDAGALWGALPAKYQADVTALKNEFAGKMDADLWNKGFALAGKLSTLLKDKKAMLLASPLGAQIPPPFKPLVESNWDAVAGSLSTLANSEIKTLDGLKSADPGKFLASTGSSLTAGVMKAAMAANPEAAAEFQKSKVELVKQDGDKATLKLVVEGKPNAEEKEFVKVDGKWLPADMVKDWDKTIADAKAELGGLTITPEVKTQFNGMVGMVEPILDKLIAAKDQAAFDGEVQGLMVIAAMMGGGPPGGSMQGPPGGGAPAPGLSAPPAGTATPPSSGTITVPPTGVTPPSGLPVVPPSTGTTVPPITPPTTVPPTTTP